MLVTISDSARFLHKFAYDHALSWDEWKGIGFWIKKGSKSPLRDPLGVPLFLPSQVNPPSEFRGRIDWDDGEADDDGVGRDFVQDMMDSGTHF